MIHRFNIEAFPLSRETEAALEGLRTEREFSKVKLSILFGGLARAVKHYADNPSPRVIIVEDPSGIDQLLKNLEQMADVVEPGRKVIVIGSINDVQVYRRLVSQGVAEYLVGPVSTQEIVEAVVEAIRDPSAKQQGRLISFIGARGGVGSTTVACNAAWTLADMTKDETILIDLDLNFGTAALGLNLDPKQSVGDALLDTERLDHTLVERFLMEHDEHLSVMSTQGTLKELYRPTTETIERLIDLTRQMAAHVVVDLPRQWSDWLSNLLVLSDEVVITAAPDLSNLRDAKMLVDWMRSRRGEQANVRLVLNKLDAAKKTQLSLKDFQESLRLAPIGVLPFEPQVFGQLSNNGQVFGEGARSHKAAATFRQLATALGARQSAERSAAPGDKPLLGWLKKKPKTQAS
ncbi:MAG TPA: AAA family ATPase [Candidatus Cybelea sp.]|nr:AAA family ATPase [Candidatus Cybelea sp.]